MRLRQAHRAHKSHTARAAHTPGAVEQSPPWALLSYLLRYPGTEVAAASEELASEVASLPDGPAKPPLERFIASRHNSPTDLAAHYVDTFDLRRRASLDLTYYAHGDTRERGMAMLRLNVPSIFIYGGSILPGNFKGRPVTVQDVFEAVGKHSVGAMTDEDLHGLEQAACPSAGACGAQFTANTMAMVSEALGIALPYSAGAPASYEIRDQFCMTAGEQIMDLVLSGIRPRDIITRKALENAAATVAASGGSTNAALHLPALANEAGIDFTLFDVAEVFKRTPYIADLKPGGRYVAKDLFEAGGIPLVMKRGGNLSENIEDALETRIHPEAVVRAVRQVGLAETGEEDQVLYIDALYAMIREVALELEHLKPVFLRHRLPDSASSPTIAYRSGLVLEAHAGRIM